MLPSLARLSLSPLGADADPHVLTDADPHVLPDADPHVLPDDVADFGREHVTLASDRWGEQLVTLEAFHVPPQARKGEWRDAAAFNAWERVIKQMARNVELKGKSGDRPFEDRADRVAEAGKAGDGSNDFTGVVVVMKLWTLGASVGAGEVVGVAAAAATNAPASASAGPSSSASPAGRATRHSRPTYDMQLLLIDQEFQGRGLGGTLLDQLLLALPRPSGVVVLLEDCIAHAKGLYVRHEFRAPLGDSRCQSRTFEEKVQLSRDVLDGIVDEVAGRRRELGIRERPGPMLRPPAPAQAPVPAPAPTVPVVLLSASESESEDSDSSAT